MPTTEPPITDGYTQPKRYSARHNPLRVERVLTYRYRLEDNPADPMDWPTFMKRIADANYRGAIVGPHGSGKTTLLEDLQPRLNALGYRARLLFMNQDDGHRLPQSWRTVLTDLQTNDILLADGYTHLNPLARRRVDRASRTAAGLIITAHYLITIPTKNILLKASTSPEIIIKIADNLDIPLNSKVSQILYKKHKGNVREAIRDLYDSISS